MVVVKTFQHGPKPFFACFDAVVDIVGISTVGMEAFPSEELEVVEVLGELAFPNGTIIRPR